jgi:hypothetical protein
MDAQMQFLQLWAVVNQRTFDWIQEAIRVHGNEKAHEMYAKKCESFMLSDAELDALSPEDSFAYWLCILAQMYQDLMWRYGVFDAE